MDKFKNFTSATGKKYDFAMILPIRKVEEQSDGTLRVYGVVTAQKPDRDKEVCNYAKTVPFYQKTVAEMLKATDVEGMEKSIMPLREMHQLKAVGKGISINFIDAERTIYMGFEVVDSETIKKVKKGVLPAFSQGGNYAEKPIKSEEFPGCMEYVADPGEVSLVDRGSLPEALIDTMKGQSFFLAKRDGSVEVIKCDGEEKPKYIERSELDTELEKINAALGELVAQHSAAKGGTMKPEDIKKCAAALGITEAEFIKQFIEGDGFQKAAKGLAALHGHIAKAMSHHEDMMAHHEKMGKMHKAHHEHLGKCMKAAKDVMGSDDEAEKAFKDLLGDLKGSEEFVSIGKTSDGVEIFKAKGAGDVKLEGLEKAAVTALKPEDVQAQIDAALKKAKADWDKELAPQNGNTGARLVLIGRDGKEISKVESNQEFNPFGA